MKNILDLSTNKLTDITKRKEKDVECPLVELVTAYVFDDSSEDLIDAIDKHLNYCANCLNLVLALRTTEAETQVPAAQLVDKLLKLTGKT